MPPSIPPLWGVVVRLDLQLDPKGGAPTGTLKNQWYDPDYRTLGVSYTIRDLLENPNRRFVYYYMPTKTREELTGAE